MPWANQLLASSADNRDFKHAPACGWVGSFIHSFIHSFNVHAHGCSAQLRHERNYQFTFK